MSLETTATTDSRTAVLLRPEIIKKRKAASARYRALHRAEMLAQLAAAREKARLKREKKNSKARVGKGKTLNLNPKNYAAFQAFANGATVNVAFSALITLAQGKKLVAKPVMVEYALVPE